MRIVIGIACLLSLVQVAAQRPVLPTNTLRIDGKIEKALNYTLADLDTFPRTGIKDVIIYNHKGEIKDTLTRLKGIPLKAVLAPLKYTYEKPKELNEFYFVFSASDGYKVVFSWNEIYNSAAGDHLYLVAEMEGKSLKDIEQRLLFAIEDADILRTHLGRFADGLGMLGRLGGGDGGVLDRILDGRHYQRTSKRLRQ